MKSWFTLFILFVLVSTIGYTQVTNKLDNLQVGTLTTKTIDVTSTVKASKPCPKMTLAERNAIVGPLEGQCVYNSTAKTLNLYDGVAWVEVAGGGTGGIANWQTGTFYDVDDVVIYSGNIYQCITLHTSGASFDPSKFNILAQDLASVTGSLDASNVGTGVISNTEFSYLNNASSEIQTQLNGKEPTITTLPLNKGGTNKDATASAGSVVYSDADSFELSSVGSVGQYLQSNGASAPTWSSISVNDAGFSGVLSLGKGGTSKSLTANNGAIAYSDADSFELLAPGTSGQILQSNGAAAPSFVNKSISAKSESSSAVSLEEIQVYNDQLTQTAAGKHKIETGNKNILVNPSFEHATFSTGWNNSAGTFSEDTVVEVDGIKAASVVLSSQTLNLRQDSTLYQSQFADGIQGLASARVKTSVSGVKLCARKAGTTQTSLCVSHTGSGKWELLKVPFILGGTSNGLVILTDTNVSGTVYVDDAFVGAVDLSATQTFDTTCDTIACATSFVAQANNSFGISNENLDWIQSCTTTSTGVATCTFNAGIFSATPNCTATSIFNNLNIIDVAPTTSNVVVRVTSNAGAFITAGFHINCQRQGSDYAAAIQAQKDYQKTKISSYSSSNADTDWQSCGHTTSSFTGFGTVSAIETQCKRSGGDLLMKGKFTSGLPTSVEARIALPLWNGVQLSSKGTSVIPSVQVSGNGNTTIANTGNFSGISTLIEPSVSYITFGRESSATNGLTKANGDSIAGNGTIVSFISRIPIEQFENSNVIIGQFNGLESCKDSYECTDTFSASISENGTILSQNIPWISGSCSVASSVYTCALRSGLAGSGANITSPLICTIGDGNTSNGIITADAAIDVSSTTQIVYRTYNASYTPTNSRVTITCQKSSADYIGKTAKAVASSMSVRSIGSENVDIQSVYFGAGSNCSTACTTANCTICNQVGAKISSVSRNASGVYFLNGIDGTKYNCIGSGTTGAAPYSVLLHTRDNSTSTYARVIISNSAGTLTDSSYNYVTCIGIP